MSAAPPPCAPRPATVADMGEIAELLHRIFGTRQTVEFLRWKLTGLAGQLIGSIVLAANARIVGFLGQIPVRVRVMGRDVSAAQGTDVGLLEEYRRLDTFLSMVQASARAMCAAGVSLAYGTANATAGPLAAKLLSPMQVASVPLLVRPLSAENRSLGAVARMLARLLSAGERLCPVKPARPLDGVRLGRVARFDARFDRFWKEVCDDYPVAVVRDAAHLNWRYVNVPGLVYERLCVESADASRIEGYAVLGLRRRGGLLRGCIADLVTARKGDPGIGSLLIRAAVDWFRAQAADVAEAWAFPHTHLRRLLVRHGFISRRTGPGGLHVSALASGAKADVTAAGHARNWFLSMGDSDTV